MFRYKSTKEQFLEAKNKAKVQEALLTQAIDAILELAEMTADQESALVELATIISEGGGK